MDEIDYTFTDALDARAYLRDVGRLWALWIVGLVTILLTHGAVLIVSSGALLIGLLVLARPLLPRAEALVPVNRREGGVMAAALRGGTTRDRVLRELAYGPDPLRSALEASRLSSRWMAVRRLVVVATLLAFVLVFVGPLS